MVNYPTSLDNNQSLYLVGNNLRTRLTSAIDETTLTIPVVTTSGFPTSGFITILSDPNDITKAEAIRYTNTTSTTFIASARGVEGTPALSHRLADNVDLTIVASHHNELKDAIIALENFVGIQGYENFLTVDDHGNVLISGTLTTSGVATFASDLDIKGNLTVTGTAHFGQTVVSTGTLSPVLFASNDIEQAVSGTTFLPVSCETSPLAAGIDYLVIYTNNNANDTSSAESYSRILYGAGPLGISNTRPSVLSGATIDTHYGGGLLSGIYKVTGDGSSTLAFQARSSALTNKALIGAMAIVAIPLSDRFTEDSDYFFEGANSDTFTVSNAAAYPTFTTIQSTNFDLEADDYIVIMSVEAATQNGSTTGFVARFTINGQVYGPEYGGNNPPVAASEGIRGIAVAHVVNIPLTGTINFLIEGCSRGSAQADFRRPRVFAIRKSLFTQVISTKNSVGTTTTNTSFQDFSGLNSTLSPTNVNSPILVLGTSNLYTLDADSVGTAAIRNETDGVDYRDDSGFQNSVIGGTLAAHGQTPLFLLHKEDRSASTEYRVRFRSSAGDSVTVGRNVDNTGGDLSELILWEYALSSAPSLPIDRTSILDEELFTGTLVADNVFARDTFEATTVTGTTGNFAGNISGQLVSGQTISGSIGKFSVSVTTNNLSVANQFTVNTLSGTTGQFGGTISADRLTAISGTFTTGITVGGSTTYIYPDEIRTPLLTAESIDISGPVSFSTGTFSTALTISGTPVLHEGITGVTVSGLNLTKGQLNFVGSRGGNVSIFGNTITFDANPAGTTGGGAGIPGGNDTEVQYNAGGAFAGDPDFTFNSSTNTLSVPAGAFSTSLTISGNPVVTGTLTVRETDGFPSVQGVHTIVVTTGTLINNGNGTVTISTGGGGGGGSGINAVAEDLTPMLGGNLNAAGFNITNVGTLQSSTVTGTTGQFGTNLSTQVISSNVGTILTLGGTNATFDTVQGAAVTGTNVQVGESVLAQGGHFSDSLTISGAPAMPARFAHNDFSRQMIVSTTAETPLLSTIIPANALLPGRALAVKIVADAFTNTTSAPTFTLSIYFGDGVPMYRETSISMGPSATVHKAWKLEFEILNADTVNYLYGDIFVSPNVATTSGIGDLAAGATLSNPLIGSGTQSVYIDQPLTVTFTPSSVTNQAGYQFNRLFATVNVV